MEEPERKGTDLAAHLEHGRTLDQVSVCVLCKMSFLLHQTATGPDSDTVGCWCGAGKKEDKTIF